MEGAVKVAADTVWTLIAGFLVFFMHAGFALLEAGFTRAKNTVNILAKNFTTVAAVSLAFFAVGFALMFGDGTSILGLKGWFLQGEHNAPEMVTTGADYVGSYSAISWAAVPLAVAFFFQLVFAATGVTIVSGAVAERIKFGAFILFAFLLGGIIYPIGGHWIWGGGFLAAGGMWDFAGSTVVHSIGGWAALAGAIVLGPRLGKYGPDGRVNAISGHSIPLATLGVFILWLGWFGFNPGSTMAADAGSIGHIAVTTNMAAAAGALTALLAARLWLKKPDFSMMLNGALAGLVAITAPCAWVTPLSAIAIGAIAGVLCVGSVIFIDQKLKVDDPVGAISVHLTNGIWGTLALGLFASVGTDAAGSDGPIKGLFFGGGGAQLLAQFKGVIVIGLFVFLSTWIIFSILKAAGALRVSEQDEIDGLDISEMGMVAYANDPSAS